MAMKRKSSGRKYGKKSQKKVSRAMHKYKHGTLKGGAGKHPKAKSRQQAIAIGLSEARKEGAKVPSKKSGSRKKSSSRKKGTARKKASSRKKSTSKKSRR